MNIKTVYEQVTSGAPMSQTDFLIHLSVGLGHLCGSYGADFVFEDGVIAMPRTVDDILPIFSEWQAPLTSYIRFSAGVGGEDFDRLADSAYKSIWRKNVRCKRFFMRRFG